MVDSSSVRARAASPALKMVLGRADSARRLVPAEPDGQFDQFGRGRGGAASARDVGGGVERFERFGVCARCRQSHVPGLQLGQDHGFGQEPVRSPALGGTGICVDAARQQPDERTAPCCRQSRGCPWLVPPKAALQLARTWCRRLARAVPRSASRRMPQPGGGLTPGSSRLMRMRISSASVPGSLEWALADPMSMARASSSA